MRLRKVIMPWMAVMCLSLGGSGCLRYSARTTAHPPVLPSAMQAPFAYQAPQVFEAKETVVDTNELYRVLRVEFDVPAFAGGTNRTMVLSHYLPLGPGPKPVVLVLPVSGGGYPLEEYFSRYFAKRGLATVIVHREKLKKSAAEMIENINKLLVQTVIDNKLVIDWIETRPELDADRVGVFGTSMGGIKGALLAPVEPRVKAAVLGLAGGDLPYILEHSSEPGVRRRRQAMLENSGYTATELREELRRKIECDPLAYGPYVDNRKVLLVLAACDTVVPFPKGWALREAMARPETRVVFSGHYTALFYLPYIQRQAWKFLAKRLDLED